jgi:hypothetical protein
MLSLFSVAPARAASSTVEVTDVYNAVNPSDEWFQLYNMTKGALTLTGWSVCTSGACLALPTTTIESFSLAKFKASALTGWPSKGLDGASDMLGIKDDSGKPVDSLNWGTPSNSWKNYESFKDMLWNPGVKSPDAAANQSFFRMAIGKDTDQVSDWLTTASKPPGQTSTATPAPGTTPRATATPGSPIGTTTTPSKTPTTGGEFPVLLALGLIVAVLGIRYFRRGFSLGSSK